MRVVFAGTPAIAVPSLLVVAAGHDLVGVLTNPDSAAGRGLQTGQSAVKQAALEHGFPLLQPARLDAGVREAIAALRPDILVCVAYGFIFGPKFLSLFPQGGINLHPSLLPRWRGPSPISAAILAGDSQTGITVQRLALEMDAGDILVQETIGLEGRETTAGLTGQVAGHGAGLVLRALAELADGSAAPRPQDHGQASYCRLITREEARIDWRQPAVAIDRQVRAFDPWPRAHSSWNGQSLTVLESLPCPGPADGASPASPPGTVLRVDKSAGILVQTGLGLLALRRLQLPAKKPLDFQAFLNGARGFVGSTLGA
jgi:methionyl-tRNA formyltransferase